MDEAAVERYARDGIHAARLSANAERERPFHLEPWEKRSEQQREQDRRGASAVAAAAVHDAGHKSEADAMELARYRAHLPAILSALRVAVDPGGYEYQRKFYRAALKALNGEGGGHD